MSFKHKSQSGVVHLQFLLLLAAVVGVIGVAGYAVMQAQNDNIDSGSSSGATIAKTKTPDSIKSASDLNASKTSLNQTNLDSDVNPDALNSDVNSLL
jgi:uncharacterized protein HemX